MHAFDASRLPYDVLWQIIDEAWHLPLSTSERIHCMTPFNLVSKVWSDAFARISSKHAHIPCPSYLERYMHFLHHDSPSSGGFSTHLRNNMCRSITVTIEPTRRRAAHTNQLPSDLFHGIKITGAVPRLKTISILYRDLPADDVFDCYQFIHFPPQVQYLRIDIDIGTRNRMSQRTHGIVNPPWYLPSLQRLTLANANEDLVASFLQACPRLDALETDFRIAELEPFDATKQSSYKAFLYHFQPCAALR